MKDVKAAEGHFSALPGYDERHVSHRALVPPKGRDPGNRRGKRDRVNDMRWQWRRQDGDYANYGNANQWTVGGGLGSLAREATQNANDARLPGDEPADLVFSFIRLTGADRLDFEEAMGWRTLADHIGAMGSAADGSATAGQLRKGLERVSARGDIVLMRVADYGCRGLTGQESASGTSGSFGNFAKLCRMDLFSGKDEASGGSFGLGKAVYWRFSTLQTVLFHSTVLPGEGVRGHHVGRLFGVQQGVVHDVGGEYFQGRGYFGNPPSDSSQLVESTWGMTDLARRLRLERNDRRPGTSALIVGFADPDDDATATTTMTDLKKQAGLLGQGVAENFWPLIARDRLRVRIEIRDGDEVVQSSVVDPGETYTELTQALRRYDDGDTAADLLEPGDVVVRDVPISVSRRTDAGAAHSAFQHTAKLVVTLSDSSEASLENRVCLLRRSEMVVETIPAAYEGHRYYAFLLAGAAVSRDHPTVEDAHADDFLRFAEPPAHDQWIPRTGRGQASQVNLGSHYAQPYKKNLTDLKFAIERELRSLFGPPPVAADRPPTSVLRKLSFLRSDEETIGGTSSGSIGGSARKPSVRVMEARLADGRWHLQLEVRATNRTQGWAIVPMLSLGGFDGSPLLLSFEDLASPEGAIADGVVMLPHVTGKRVLRTVVSARSGPLPVPPEETAVAVVLTQKGAAKVLAGGDK